MWTRVEAERIEQAYLRMAELGYRALLVRAAEPAPREQIQEEAAEYAARFIAEEDAGSFNLGVSDYDHNRALVYCVEACRLLNVGSRGKYLARVLLGEATREMDAVIEAYARKKTA